MVALLVNSRECAVVWSDNVVFQLAHRLELHACNLAESLSSLCQSVLRCALEWLSVLVEEGSEHAESRNFCEWVNESCAVARHYIEVAAACADEWEQA